MIHSIERNESMKKKIIAVLLACMMIIPNAFAADYNDIEKDSDYGSAVSVLSSLDILNGYSDGSFKPNATITRAEFAAVVVRALGMGDAAEGFKGATQFNDVPADYWASGYINIASSNGIINGYGDGNFGPDDLVLYEDAIKMVVAALGYNPEAETKGGYPGGYMTIAAREGILNNVKNGSMGQGANRGMVAQMVFNSLEVPIMDQVGYGTSVTFEQTSDVLLDKLDVDKVEGVVTKVPGSTDSRLPSYKVVYHVQKQYEVSGNKRVLRSANYTINADVGDTNAKDMLEQYTYAYIKDLDDDPLMIAIIEKSGRNEKFVLDSEDIDDTQTEKIKDGRFYYYKDKDKESSKYVTLSDNITYYYNYKKVGGADLTDLYDAVNKGINGEIQFLDNNNDDEYNVIYVVDYIDAVVDSVSEKTYKIIDKNGGRYILDEDDSDYNFTIEKDGKPATFDDIAVGDVLSICGNLSDDKHLTNGTVYIVSNSSVYGTVTSYDTDDRTLKLDGVSYDYSKALDGSIKLGYEGTFYLNVRKKIIAMDKTNTAGSYKFGFATKMVKYNGISDGAEIKILTASGTWSIYDLASRVTVNGVSPTVKSSELFGSNFNKYKPSDWNGTATSYMVPVYSLISYNVNSSGEINRINFNLGSKDVKEDDYYYKAFNGDYVEAVDSLPGGVYLTDSTVIFDVDATSSTRYNVDEDNISVISRSALVDRNTYNGNAFGDIDTGNAYAVVGYGISGRISYTSGFMVISGMSRDYVDGDELVNLTVLKNGDKTSVMYDPNDVTITANSKTSVTKSVSGLKIGDVITGTVGAGNKLKKITLLARPSDMISNRRVINPYNTNSVILESISGSTDVDFVYGLIRYKSGNTLALALDDRYEREMSYSLRSSNVYTYDALNYSNAKVKLGDVGDLDADKTPDASPYSDDGEFIFARVENSAVLKDILVIKRDTSLTDDGKAPATPTPSPTAEPSATPTAEPSATPTASPSATPTASPSATPTASPSATPTASPSATPTAPAPSATPTASPSATPTATPSATPTASPSATATAPAPSATPTASPSATAPAPAPSATPTAQVVRGSENVIVMSAASGIKDGEQLTVGTKIYKKGENAFATIKDALAKVSGGGTVTLRDNVYSGDFVISKPVTIEGEGMVTVNGTFECAVQNITFKNLTITYNRTAAGESAIVLREGVSENSISARGCNFVNVAKGTAGVAVKSSSGKQANTNANAGGSGGSGKSKSETVKIETTAKPETKPEDVKSKTKSED